MQEIWENREKLAEDDPKKIFETPYIFPLPVTYK